MRAKRKTPTMLVGPPPSPAPLISVTQLAFRLSVSEGVVRRRVNAGLWTATTVNGRLQFSQEEVAMIVADQRAAASKKAEDETDLK